MNPANQNVEQNADDACDEITDFLLARLLAHFIPCDIISAQKSLAGIAQRNE